MNKTILIIYIFGILISIGIVVGFGYQLLHEKTPVQTSSTQTVSISGEVKKITDSTLTIATDKETLDVLINAETKFITPDLTKINTNQENGTKGPSSVVAKEIKLEDIKIGDSVNILAEKKNENLTGINISVLPK